jgi:hypothetical protein
MTVDELIARFPEIPPDLSGEPTLAQLAACCGDLLQVAQKPSNCSVQYDAGNHYYLKLVGPLAIYGYGLAKREKVVQQLQDLVDRQQADPGAFAASLLPAGTVATEVRGPGCG